MFANLASPDDLTALVHNPAGLADQRGMQIHLSASYAFLRSGFQLRALDPALYPEINAVGCTSSAARSCRWPIDERGYYRQVIEPERSFGVVPYLALGTDLGFLGPRGRDLVLAAAVYSPSFYGAFMPEAAPTSYHIVEGVFLVVAATVGLAWRPSERISLGVSVSYHHMRLSYAQKFATTALMTAPGDAPGPAAEAAQALVGDIQLHYAGIDHGLGWGVGLIVRATPWLRLGLSYSGATSARFRGNLTLTGGGLVGEDPSALRAVIRSSGIELPTQLIVEMPIPHALIGGINLAPCWWLEIGVDLRLWFYNFFKRQEIVPVYASDVPRADQLFTRESLSSKKNYGLSWELALGVLIRPLRWYRSLELMSGMFYDRSPTPDETFSLDNPALSQLSAAVGGRVRLSDRWRVTLTYMVLFYLAREIRTSTTSPPTNVRGGGTNHMPGLELEYSF
jgi:long-subunit fatty acid transport protein